MAMSHDPSNPRVQGNDARSDHPLGALIARAVEGDPEAIDALYQSIYEEFRTMAGGIVKQDRDLAQPTSLVHEGFMRLFTQTRNWPSSERAYFFFAAARVMRDILAERKRSAASKPASEPLDQIADDYLKDFEGRQKADFLELHNLLNRFSKSRNPQKRRRHQLVEMVYLGGITIQEAAECVGISYSQAREDLRLAKAELKNSLAQSSDDEL